MADLEGKFIKKLYVRRKVSDNSGELHKFIYELARSAEIRG
jgi:hypothetical protein